MQDETTMTTLQEQQGEATDDAASVYGHANECEKPARKRRSDAGRPRKSDAAATAGVKDSLTTAPPVSTTPLPVVAPYLPPVALHPLSATEIDAMRRYRRYESTEQDAIMVAIDTADYYADKLDVLGEECMADVAGILAAVLAGRSKAGV